MENKEASRTFAHPFGWEIIVSHTFQGEMVGTLGFVDGILRVRLCTLGKKLPGTPISKLKWGK